MRCYSTVNAASTAKPVVTLALRPDVQRVVDELVGIFRDYRRRVNPWRLYSHAKDAISRRCGWDALPADYDQDQFELAVARYIAEVGL